MLLLKTLNFFLDAVPGGPTGGPCDEHKAANNFTNERLSSSAWEGWWHDADQGFPGDA
ncbi:hypothetical protein [Paenarthrobacter sp. NPDC018779]|uniref:hypothetical protein n=1 Tax=Paenarthrobacter sp. NPDC018779 TaxID=3364375 RepID=UPI0037C98E1F